MFTLPRLAFATLAPTAAALPALPPPAFVVRPEARVETEPSRVGGDSYDDPAIWLHPTDPTKSLILGTNKQGGLHVFDMDGRQLQIANRECRPDNVDVLYGFPLDGKSVDLAVAGCREGKRPCVRVWRIDPERRELVELTGRDGIKVFDGQEPYGSCTYRSPKTGKFYFFVNHKSGGYEQYELTSPMGTLAATRVRTFKLASVAEGCVADEETGTLYAAEEQAGVWRLGAEPDADPEKKLIAKVGENGLTADVEGVTIYSMRDGKGYLLVSSQGNNTFKIYDRGTGNAFLGTIDPKAGKLGGVADTDGIAVTNRPTSDRFPKGVFVVQDGTGHKDGQRFKLYGWEDIAGDHLMIDTEWSPRGKP